MINSTFNELTEIKEFFKNLGYEDKIIEGQPKELFSYLNWYKGFVKEFHEYKVYKGKGQYINKTKETLNLVKLVSQAYATLLCNEKTDIVLPNEKDNILLNKILTNCNFWSLINHNVEISSALGYGGVNIRVENYEITERTNRIVKGGKLKIDFVNATKIIPISFRDDEMCECACLKLGTKDAILVIFYEQEDENNNYKNYIATINYKLSKDRTWKQSGKEIKEIKIPMFHTFKLNLVNNVDIDSPLGIPPYANAISSMKICENIHDSLNNEFENGRKRLFAHESMMHIDENGKSYSVFDDKDATIHVIPSSLNASDVLTDTTSELRASAHIESLNAELSLFSEQCGLGKGFFTYSSSGNGRPIQTATAIIAQHTELFNTIQKNQIYIEKYLKRIVQSVIWATNNMCDGEKFSQDYDLDEISIRFDDSIFSDKESEKESARKDVANGILSVPEYREKFYAEDKDLAIEKANENAFYVASKGVQLLPLLESGVITAKAYVILVYGKEDSQLEKMIEENLKKKSMSLDDALASFGA